jgi:hypothetical protein
MRRSSNIKRVLIEDDNIIVLTDTKSLIEDDTVATTYIEILIEDGTVAIIVTRKPIISMN